MDIRKKASWVARTVVLVVTVTLVLEGVLVWDLVSAYVNRPAIDLGTSGNAYDAYSAGVVERPESGGSKAVWKVDTHGGACGLEPPLPTASGAVVIVSDNDVENGPRGPYVTSYATAVVSLDPADGSVRWYHSIKGVDVCGFYSSWRAHEANLSSFYTTYALTSPDGRYLAIRLVPVYTQGEPDRRPLWDREDDAPPQQSQTIVVLSAESGEVVRSMSASQNVLGQVLTNEELVVETSPTFHADSATITSYPLSDPQASPSSWKATGWLMGAIADSVMISPYSDTDLCHNYTTCLTTTVTLADPASGETRSSLDHVYRIYPNGWVERVTGDWAADLRPYSQQWYASSRELVDMASGVRADITGFSLQEKVTPSGTAWILCDDTWVETEDRGVKKLDRKLTRTSWLPASSGYLAGQQVSLHNEPLDTLSVDFDDYVIREILPMGGTAD